MNEREMLYTPATVLSIGVGLIYYFVGASLIVQITGALMTLYSILYIYESYTIEKPNIEFLRDMSVLIGITVTIHWIFLLNQPFVGLIIGILYYLIFSLTTDLIETHLEFERIRGKYNG